MMCTPYSKHGNDYFFEVLTVYWNMWTTLLLDVLRLLSTYFAAFLSLTVVGYQSLLPILQDEKIFHSLCPDGEDTCNAQTLRLDMMFNIAINGLSTACLLWGLLAGNYGPKPGVVLGGVLLSGGALVFSFGYDWPCFFAYIVMGIGCCSVLFGILHIPAQYPKIQGLLFSLLTGSFDASSGITYIFLMLYKHYGVSMQTLYIGLASTSALSTVILYFFALSPYFENRNKTDKHDAIKPKTVNNNDTKIQLITEEHSINNPPNAPVLPKPDNQNQQQKLVIVSNDIFVQMSWKKVFQTTEFMVVTIWCMIFIMTKYFYITTVNKQISWITNGNDHKVYVSQQIFSAILLLSGTYSIITGPIIDKAGIKFSIVLMGIVAIIASVCSVTKVFNLQWFTMWLFVFNRFFFFSVAPLLCHIIFGAKRQQTIYGLMCFLSAIFNLSGYLFDAIITYDLDGNYTIVNLSTGVACLLSAVWLSFVLRKHKYIT
eukprot:205440_1